MTIAGTQENLSAPADYRWILDGRLGGTRPHWVLSKAERLMIVPDAIRQCVAFAYYEAADGSKVPAGTVFFVADSETVLGQELRFVYGVTARHVIEKIISNGSGGIVWLRLNTLDGESDWVSVPLDLWWGHPADRDSMWSAHHDEPRFDVSACLFVPEHTNFLLRTLPTSMFINQETIVEHAIGAGDEIFLTGLFANHLGQRKNLPIVRCGNIAAMPDEPVETDLGPMDDAILIEARSIGGLSGSPVVVSVSGIRRIGEAYGLQTRWSLHLLGLVHGHWDARHGDTVPDNAGGQETINKGIAIVAPARHILETIRQERFLNIRAAEIQKFRDANAPMMDGT